MKKQKPSAQELGSMTLALAQLLHAGIGPADALYLLSEDDPRPQWKTLLRDMARKADSGSTLARCFAETGVFPGYLCTLLSVGEQVGRTEQTLLSLSEYYEAVDRLEKQLRSALTYPVILLTVLLSVLVVLLVWVLPVFDGVYAQLGGGLTGVAGWLLTLGQSIGRALPWLCGLLVFSGVLLAVPAVRKKLSAYWADRGLWAEVNSARFLQAMALGINSGMTPQEAATLASGLAQADMPAFQARCSRCRTALEENTPLPEALKRSNMLTPAQARLLQAGMRSGQAETSMSYLANSALEQSMDRVAGLAEKIEPAVVIFACVLIGLVLLSVMLPLMNIMNSIG